MGTPENDATGSFWMADVEEAAQALAVILLDERVDVLTIYDPEGTYGHPDHIQVHRVGIRAAELASTPVVFEATANRDHIRRLSAKMRELAPAIEDAEQMPDPDEMNLGVNEEIITTTIDVRDFIETKRSAMAAHGSQIGTTSFFLTMPIEAFREAFGYEWFIRHGATSDLRETSLY